MDGQGLYCQGQGLFRQGSGNGESALGSDQLGHRRSIPREMCVASL